jgi:hypothetical protein
MDRIASMLVGAGLGAGLMYILDPQMGRRRRALARDKMVSMGHTAQDAAGVVSRDMRNRAQGLASGDLSVLAGGKRALSNPLRGGWSPSGRALMTVLGGGLFVYGLTRNHPEACVLGSLGLAFAAEGITNLGISDITKAGGQLAEQASNVADKASATAKSVTDAAREMVAI